MSSNFWDFGIYKAIFLCLRKPLGCGQCDRHRDVYASVNRVNIASDNVRIKLLPEHMRIL